MKIRIPLFHFIFLLGATNGNRPLSLEENMHLQRICGTKPAPRDIFSDVEHLRRQIYGGKEIPGNEAPWSIHLDIGGDRCSATLLSSRHILTATHCIQRNATDRSRILDQAHHRCEYNDLIYTKKDFEITVYNSNVHMIASNVVQITMFTMCLVLDSLHDDIAILELKTDLQFSNYVFPICIPNDLHLQKPNSWVYATGFGYNRLLFNDTHPDPPVLRRARLVYVQPIDNNRRFSGFDPFKIYGLRAGDSGGTAYVKTPEKKWFVIGVPNSAKDDFTAKFASVGNHYTQICFHTGIC